MQKLQQISQALGLHLFILRPCAINKDLSWFQPEGGGNWFNNLNSCIWKWKHFPIWMSSSMYEQNLETHLLRGWTIAATFTDDYQ